MTIEQKYCGLERSLGSLIEWKRSAHFFVGGHPGVECRDGLYAKVKGAWRNLLMTLVLNCVKQQTLSTTATTRKSCEKGIIWSSRIEMFRTQIVVDNDGVLLLDIIVCSSLCNTLSTEI